MCRGHSPHGRGAPTDATALRDELIGRLHEAGYLTTAQRRAVVEAIARTDGHICAEHLLDHVRSEHPELRVNKTTVYRTLDVLLALGLITEMKCGEWRAQYELASRGPHYHMVCERCGTVTDVDADIAASLERSLYRRHGFRIDLLSRPFIGLCQACR